MIEAFIATVYGLVMFVLGVMHQRSAHEAPKFEPHRPRADRLLEQHKEIA